MKPLKVIILIGLLIAIIIFTFQVVLTRRYAITPNDFVEYMINHEYYVSSSTTNLSEELCGFLYTNTGGNTNPSDDTHLLV
jgi:hypothetical protein